METPPAFSQSVGTVKLPASVVALTSSSNPSTVGQQVTFMAVVTATGYAGTPTGTVTFTVDGQAQTPVPVSVVGGVDEAQFAMSTLTAGQHTVTAAYSGDANVSPSTGSLPTQTVTSPSLHATTTTVTSSLDPSTVGQPVTFTAVVAAPGLQGTPTGTVTFTIDGQAQTPVSLAVVGGMDEAQFVTSTLTAGQHSVTEAYSGDVNFSPSSGSLPTQTVTSPSLHATTTTLTSSLDPSTVGQPVTFSAVVTAPGLQGTPTGTVTFTIDGQAQTPVSLAVVGGMDEAQFVASTLTAGQHSVSAAYSGDVNFSPSNGSLPTQTVNAPNLQATTTTLVSSLNPSTVGQPVTFTAVVSPSGATGTPSGSVTFTIDGVSHAPVPLQLVSGRDQATLSITSLGAGTHAISAAYSGDPSFAASAVARPLVETVAVVNHPGVVDGPTIELVQRFGIHMQPTVLVLSFNEALDLTSAVNPDNYRITDPTGRSVGISSAVFDPKTNTVTLRPAERINLHQTYHLTVIGTGTDGVRSTTGLLLDGTDKGTADSNYKGTLDWRNVVLTPAELKICSPEPSQAGRSPESPFSWLNPLEPQLTGVINHSLNRGNHRAEVFDQPPAHDAVVEAIAEPRRRLAVS